MPAPSKIDLLPPSIRSELDKRLIETGFSQYQELSDWLKTDHAIDISKSAIGTYGKGLEAQIAELRLSHNFAQAYAQALPDDAGLMPQMLNEMSQDTLYHIMLRLHKQSRSLTDESDLWGLLRQIETATKALANLGRTDIAVRKFAEELKAKAELIADSLKSEGEKTGIDADYLRRIESEWLGLF